MIDGYLVKQLNRTKVSMKHKQDENPWRRSKYEECSRLTSGTFFRDDHVIPGRSFIFLALVCFSENEINFDESCDPKNQSKCDRQVTFSTLPIKTRRNRRQLSEQNGCRTKERSPSLLKGRDVLETAEFI